MKKNIEKVGKFVIETEASALLKLASDLPKDFSEVLNKWEIYSKSSNM